MFWPIAHEALAHFRDKNKFASECQKIRTFIPLKSFYQFCYFDNFAETAANPDRRPI